MITVNNFCKGKRFVIVHLGSIWVAGKAHLRNFLLEFPSVGTVEFLVLSAARIDSSAE